MHLQCTYMMSMTPVSDENWQIWHSHVWQIKNFTTETFFVKTFLSLLINHRLHPEYFLITPLCTLNSTKSLYDAVL